MVWGRCKRRGEADQVAMAMAMATEKLRWNSSFLQFTLPRQAVNCMYNYKN